VATRKIRLWPDPVLSQKCTRIRPDDPDVEGLIADLFDTMYHAKGRGLAAPQIGITKRVFVVDVTWKEAVPTPLAFINPVIKNVSDDSVDMHEQCLSIPKIPMQVTRPARIQLHWQTLDGHSVNRAFDGNEARCIQHELDHLNGTVIFDHQPPKIRAKLEADYAP